jgi:hypothetical protein
LRAFIPAWYIYQVSGQVKLKYCFLQLSTSTNTYDADKIVEPNKAQATLTLPTEPPDETEVPSVKLCPNAEATKKVRTEDVRRLL